MGCTVSRGIQEMEHQPLCRPVDDGDYEYSAINDHGNDDSSRLSLPKLEGSYLFEEAIASTGTGSFHYLLLCVCGWALASDSVEIQVWLMIYYALFFQFNISFFFY